MFEDYVQKSDKDLLVPINKALMRVIEGMELKDSGYVFQTKSNSRGAKFREQPWHENHITWTFKKYIRALKLNNDYSPHSLRHTYSTFLRERGVPLDIVQKLLGHASARTTEEHYDHSIALHFREQADFVDFDERD